jgi:ketosteroid isomerase-like protein
MAGTMRTSRIVAAVVLTSALLAPVQARAQRTDATSRLQRLEDVQEIQVLLLSYGRNLDARDFKAYSLLFARDGVWAGGMGTVQGPAAIQALMEKAIPGPNGAHNYHILSNFVIDVTGDTATAWSRWMFMVPGPNNTAVAAQSGRYEDTLVREDGRWKFKKRVASNDIPASGPPPAALTK